MNTKPTIFAVSSGAGRAGIAVVRVSGPAAHLAIELIAGKLTPVRLATYRTFHSISGEVLIDQGLVFWFVGPQSVTGEDVAEFHVHGSPAVVGLLLSELGLIPGLKLAQAGEFSKRAFENGKMDLVEVEGLADLLAAESEPQRRLAMRQFSGEASAVYQEWRAQLLDILAYVEASIDFADEADVAAEAIEKIKPRLIALVASLQEAMEKSLQASAVRSGLRIVIAGPPNVGKSSLLNGLVGRKAAIVSEIAGTTRDVIEAPILIAGLPVSLSDTAGLRSHSDDPIEREGMARSLSEVESADILVWVLARDVAEMALPLRKPDLVVMNKCDLKGEKSIQGRNETPDLIFVEVSARDGTGMQSLRQQLESMVLQHSSCATDAVMVRERHRTAVSESIRYLNDAHKHDGHELELVAEDVRKAMTSLASITGRVNVEEFLGRIFQEFCVGK